MGNGRSRQADRERAAARVKLGKALACLALAGAPALGCGSTDEAGDGASDDADSDTSGGTTSGAATSPGPVASLDDLLRELAVIACRTDCSERAAFEFVFDVECLEIYTLVYDSLGASLRRSLDAGTTSFDTPAAQRCVDELSATACGTTPVVSACDEVFVGQVPLGGACTESGECAGSAYCEDTLACPGTCVASLPEGAACAEGGECETGFACSAEGVCGALKATGEPCENGSECQTHYCDDDASSCAEPPPLFVKAVGEPCQFPYECERNLYCPLDGVAEATCTPAPQPGEPCQASGLKTACTDGSYCAPESDGDTGICVVEVPVGGSCTESMQCGTGICDGGVCVKYSAIGGPCVTDERCFGVCQDGVCAPEPACNEDG